MTLQKTLLISIIISLILLAGCANDVQETRVISRTATPNPEADLLKEVEAGKLVAAYGQEALMTGNTPGETYLIIRNAYDREQTFAITPCEGCTMESSVKIPAQGHVTLKIIVTTPGEKEVVVKDSLNNYYGSARFTVKQ